MNTKNRITVEICAASIEDCIVAKQAGADRVELVVAHQLGGLTPTTAMVELVKEQVGINVQAIVRPRSSGFCYSQEDFLLMKREAKNLIHAGADGLVFGILKENGTLDIERLKEFVQEVQSTNPNVELVFHRAIDIISNVDEAVESLIRMGVHRILTSGGKGSAYEGIPRVAHMQKEYGQQIEIMAGGGIKLNNIREIIEQTQVNSVHFGGTHLVEDFSAKGSDINFGMDKILLPQEYTRVSFNNIQEMITKGRIEQ